MPQNGVNELLALLRKSRLLKEEQLAELQQLVQQPESAELTAEEFAQRLVQQQILTDWQSGQILRGQTGFVLQQYRLMNPVGRGGMGHVFRAIDDRNGDVVAIKVMAKKLSANQTLVNRFRREIRASSQLNCPHIVRTLDAGRVGKTDFMVMEYVNGEQLDRLATRLMLIPERICCEIIRQAAVGLQHAYEKQMVHRDIKPANLIIHWSDDGRGTVKVMDMGLVRLTAETEEQKTVTKAGQVMGTPDYMSPEQGWDTTKVDIRSDIYSLGLTFFRLLTGRIPFPGDNPLQVLMARCSRDAPSPRGFRPEISPEVDAVVRRMTLRDPSTRYQTPNELIADLEPLCASLTRDAVQAGETNEWESQELRIVTGDASQADIQDAGYQQFLREMDSGAAVDLMTVSGGGGDASISGTLPVIDRGANPATRRSRPHRKLPVSVVAALTASAAVIGIVIALSGGESDSEGNGSSGSAADGTPEVVKPLPAAVLAKPEPASVIAGESVSVQTQLTIRTPPAAGQLVFALGRTAPASATINKETGQVTWDVPQTQTPLDYHLPIEVYHEEDNARRLVTKEVLTIRVLPVATTYAFPEIPNQRITVGQKFEQVFAANPSPANSDTVRYEITSGALPGMEYAPDSGRFTWTPDANDVGRHEIVLKLVNVADQKVLASRTLRLVVRPGMLRIDVPDYPEQTAKAGELFRMSLGDRPLTTLPRAVRIRVAPESPRGVVLDLQKPELSWLVPADVSGRVEIKIVAEPAFPDVEFAQDSKLDTRIVVNVQPGAQPKSVPNEADVDAEETKLKELLSREFAQLRTVAQRQELAYQLLERAIGLPDGPQHFALLNLAEEQSERARAAEQLFEIHRLRALRYGVDELTNGLTTAESFRRSSVSGVQADLVIEQTVRLALLAVRQDRWKDAGPLLEPAAQLLRGSTGLEKVLAGDLEQVRKVAEQVVAGTIPKEELSVQEAERLLAKWQFAPLFDQPSTLAFLQAGTNPGTGAGDGRDRWTITSERFHLTKTDQGVLTGFLESARESERYVIRFHAGPGTNALQFVFGASPSQQLDGFVLTLDPTGYGRIQKLPGGAVISEASTASVPAAPYGQIVEIAVDGQQVSARINGQQVANQRIPELRPGRVGILAPLSRPAPGPACDIRRPRILVLNGN